MINVMLVGAWFLIQQQCCLADAGPPPRAVMIDPLMRRSPLEKNFIRFGRSWPLKQPAQANSPLEELKKMLTDGTGERIPRGKENFIRFGRSQLSSWITHNYLYQNSEQDPLGGRLKSGGPSERRDTLFNKLNHESLASDTMSRPPRSKQGFIRFGRSNSMFNKNKKYSGLNKDNFIRFGRAVESSEHNSVLQDVKQPDFCGGRFDKTDNCTLRLKKRIKAAESGKTKQSAPKGTHDEERVVTCGVCGFKSPLKFDPAALMAPEFSLLPKIPFPLTPIKTDFIRFG